MKKLIWLVSWALVLVIFCSCSDNSKPDTRKLFTSIAPDSSGIKFINKLTFDQKFNIYTYRNFYNGGGVGLGDINNDGLIDIYLTANQGSNKLYLNKGNFHFEDITEDAGVAGTKAWSTGVSLADVNADGYLDIYVCNSGDVKGDNKENELFINNGDLTFTERAREYGVADRGFTTHAAFFDYDNDSDLDLYILNNSYQAIGSFNLRKNIRDQRDSLGGDKLLRNDGARLPDGQGKFVDVSGEAGIYGSVIGFGLGVTVGDINKDGWLDIYVSNDFFERDYLYINNQDGTFKEDLPSYIRSISGASMGADLADIDNDAQSDLFVTEMLPHDNNRLKTVTTFEDWNRYQYNLDNGYYHQFTRNMLQINNGNGTFSELGRQAGVEATDWSWGALLFDMDNDGRKDIFVANGIYQDLTNQDFLQFASSEEFIKSVLSNNTVDYKKLTEIIPSNPVANFAYRNNGNLSFTNKAEEWGLSDPGFSNGSAYGDLDNDGDLDLVINNVNMFPFIYKNESREQLKGNYIKFILKGEGGNKQAIGTKLTLFVGEKKFYLEQMPIRGFESTVDSRPNFGLGNITHIDSAWIEWPSNSITKLGRTEVNQIIVLLQEEALTNPTNKNSRIAFNSSFHFENDKNSGIDFVHRENRFVDFDRDKLIYHMLSTEGPRMSIGKMKEDQPGILFIGGAKDEPPSLFRETQSGFIRQSVESFHKDKTSEDAGSVFFDADNDGDLDLYVCSGGNEFPTSSDALLDRLYFNESGTYVKSNQLLPTQKFESTSVVCPADYNSDGDLDLFVGARLQPFAYGMPMNGYILDNDGKGIFTDVTKSVAPGLLNVGMITDALWQDIDNDGDPDLIFAGEYMPVKIFMNEKGRFSDVLGKLGLLKTNGWWTRIKSADLDNDGDLDFVLGNHGLNSRFKADSLHPVCMFINDFDKNTSYEQIICTFNGETSYPLVLRHDLISQLPALKKKYIKYETYKDQTVTDIFTQEELEGSIKLDVYTLATSVLWNNGNKNWTLRELPYQAQMSITFGIGIYDFDVDGNLDLLLGGNLFSVKPEVGRYDGSYGTVLLGDGKQHFKFLKNKKTGLKLEGEVRDIQIIDTKSSPSPRIVISRNNDSVIVLKLIR